MPLSVGITNIPAPSGSVTFTTDATTDLIFNFPANWWPVACEFDITVGLVASAINNNDAAAMAFGGNTSGMSGNFTQIQSPTFTGPVNASGDGANSNPDAITMLSKMRFSYQPDPNITTINVRWTAYFSFLPGLTLIAPVTFVELVMTKSVFTP